MICGNIRPNRSSYNKTLSPPPRTDLPPPIPSASPLLRVGIALLCRESYGIDLDTIDPHVWVPVHLSAQDCLTSPTLYLGDMELEDYHLFVWWSLSHHCYLAQYQPIER